MKQKTIVEQIKEVLKSSTEDEKKEFVQKMALRLKKSQELEQIKQCKEKFGFDFRKCMKNAKYLKSNSNFIRFYEELRNYFFSHNMMDLVVKMNKVSEGILHSFVYTTDNKIFTYISDNIEIFDENICKITFLPSNEDIELYWIEIYNAGKGLGSILMNAFNEVSKKTGIKIKLKLGTPGKIYDETNEERQRNLAL